MTVILRNRGLLCEIPLNSVCVAQRPHTCDLSPLLPLCLSSQTSSASLSSALLRAWASSVSRNAPSLTVRFPCPSSFRCQCSMTDCAFPPPHPASSLVLASVYARRIPLPRTRCAITSKLCLSMVIPHTLTRLARLRHAPNQNAISMFTSLLTGIPQHRPHRSRYCYGRLRLRRILGVPLGQARRRPPRGEACRDRGAAGESGRC